MEWNEIIFPTSERRWISDPSLGDWLPVRTSLLWTSCNLSLVDSRAPSWTDRTTWRTLISLSSELRLLFSSLLLPCSWSQKSLSFTIKSNEGLKLPFSRLRLKEFSCSDIFCFQRGKQNIQWRPLLHCFDHVFFYGPQERLLPFVDLHTSYLGWCKELTSNTNGDSSGDVSIMIVMLYHVIPIAS